MVDKPSIQISKDGKELTHLNGEIVSIDYIDSIDNEVDGLTIKFAFSFDPPLFGDKLDVSIGLNSELEYIGKWYVSGNSEQPKEGTAELKLTPVAFSKAIKERRSTTYNNITLDNILQNIAKRHGLKVSNDDKKSRYITKSQTNESDLAFMKRIASEIGATFSIKNETIIFKYKSLSEQRSELPIISLDLSQVDTVSIERVDKTIYQSGIAKWHDTKSNQTKQVQIGKGESVLQIEGSYQNKADALQKLQAELQKENSGSIRGSLSTTEPVIAGALLTINLGDREEKELQITEVKRTISSSGDNKHVTFSK